ncbi:MAG: hypothetical protein M0P69_20130 [Bacteroidales bacterium]|nr:hypothetical protein [Bacteroidales bacterium]
MLDLTKISFPAAMTLALYKSQRSLDDIATEMGWSPSQSQRFFNESDAYWPNLPSVPRLCCAMGNTVIIQWLLANAQCMGMGENAAPLDPTRFILAMGNLFRAMGRIATDGGHAIEDGEISHDEARMIMKHLGKLAVDLMDFMASTEAAKELSGRN